MPFNVPIFTPNPTGPTFTDYGNVPTVVPPIAGDDNPPTVTGHTTGATPDGSGPVTQAPIGASSPDLLVVRQGGSGGGGGISVGALAILALLGVGGYFVYKRLRGDS